MTEQYNVEEGLKKKGFFNHLMLQSEVLRLTNKEDFDPSSLIAELKINGVQVKIVDFNEVLEDWSNRIEAQVKDQLEYMSSEKSVIDNAELLLRKKMGKVYDILSELEDNLWKLED